MYSKRWLLSVVAVGFGCALLAQEPKQQPKQDKRKPAALRLELPKGARAQRNVSYVNDGHERQKLDLYLPEGRGPLPVIVWVHGGAWKQGSKDRCPAIPFLNKGYAVASINYRLSQHAPFPAQIEDCKAAIRWLRAHAKDYRLDPGRVGVWGASAGGHLVALLGTAGDAKELEGEGGNADQSSRVQAVCDWFGPADFVPWLGKSTSATNAVAQLLGGPVADKLELARKASPTTFVSKDDPPFLIMHGDKDPLVPVAQSEVLADALKKAGVDVMLKVLPGAGHGGAVFLDAENRKLIEDFFDKHLQAKK